MLNIQCNPAPAFSPQHRLCIRFLYWRGFFLPLFFRIQENGCVYQNRESAVSQISGICQDSSNHVLVPRFTGIVWNRGIVHEFRQLSNTHPHVISGKQVQHSASRTVSIVRGNTLLFPLSFFPSNSLLQTIELNFP